MFDGIVPKLILWHHFLDDIVKPERANQESCAWIFADIKLKVWHVIEVKNVGLKGKSIAHSFAPDKKDFARIKRKARKYGLTRIGCVHTHVVKGDKGNFISKTEAEKLEEEIKNQSRPSEADLKYARKFNDIVRTIIVVQYLGYGEKGIIRNIIWFDQYGNILE